MNKEEKSTGTEYEKFVTVFTFNFAYEAYIVRGRLESEGIECFLQDEYYLQLNPFATSAIGGVKLQVWEKDLNRTIEILKETGYFKEEDKSMNNDKDLNLTQLKKSKWWREGLSFGIFMYVSMEILYPLIAGKDITQKELLIKIPVWIILSLLFSFFRHRTNITNIWIGLCCGFVYPIVIKKDLINLFDDKGLNGAAILLIIIAVAILPTCLRVLFKKIFFK